MRRRRLRSGVGASRTLLVEGWRFLPHSYALVNQCQLLEMSKYARVLHRDAPLYDPGWRPTEGVFEPAQERALRALPELAPGERPDAAYRVSYPYNFHPSPAPRTLVYGTAEYCCVADGDFAPMGTLRRALAESDFLLVAPSEWTREGFLRSGAPPERILRVPHGADISVFRPLPFAERAALRARMGLDSFTYLTIGSVSANKGVNLLFKAFAAVLERAPSARLLVKGLDALYPSRRFLAIAARDLTDAERTRVQARLVYIGETLSQRQLAELYQACDAYVSPYLAEGFNLPVLEAAACGLPVICTSGGPTDDFTAPEFALWIESRREPAEAVPGGLLLRPDPDHLLHSMLEALEDRSFVEAARIAGPAYVAAGFTWDHAARRIVELALA